MAVVPFANLTGDSTKEYFSDGLAEELINDRDLGVTTILEGSVRSAGEHVRITAQLVNARTGYEVVVADIRPPLRRHLQAGG